MISKKPALNVTHPSLASQWHTDNDKRPEDVTAGSGYRAKWECPTHKYVWESTVCNRAKNGSGCPVCASKVVIAGVNDLAFLRPDRAAEWHPDNVKRADEVSVGAGYRAKWLCDNGHEWETAVCNRTTESVNTDCPVCSNKKVVSGVNDIATTHPNLVPEWSKENKLLPTQVCSGSNKKVAWECANGHVWKTTVYSRAIEGTNCAKCSGRVTDIGVNDFETLHPDIAAQWDPSNPKPPSEYRPGSSQNVGWICDKGHSWKAAICTRVLQKTGCPVCANKVVVVGFNDLDTAAPHLVKEWHEDNDKKSCEVVPGSFYNAKWKCGKGHVWSATVASRVRGNGCPYCSGRLPIVGVTDVATTHPYLIGELHGSNERDLTQVSAGSDVRFTWECRKGHVWTSQIKHRTLRGQGCPECAWGTFSSKGENELAEFIESIIPGDTILRNHRNIKNVSELDIYVPDKNIAFEFNGVYYHSEARGHTVNSHRDKLISVRDAGISLVVVWEDDWRDRRPVVEKLVMAKLNMSVKGKGARSYSVDVIVPKIESDILLSNNHIQGPASGTVYIGLRDADGKLVSALVATRRDTSMEIVRYASSESIKGGFSRLLSSLRKIAIEMGVTSVYTYSDESVSEGKLYLDNGFTAAGIVPPKYGVVYKLSRHHVSSFKRERFMKDDSLKYDPELSLVELYALNKMHRYWDYGKIRWEIQL